MGAERAEKWTFTSSGIPRLIVDDARVEVAKWEMEAQTTLPDLICQSWKMAEAWPVSVASLQL